MEKDNKKNKQKNVIIEKPEKKINNKLMYFLAFIIPVIIFFITAALAGYLPFGKEIYQVYDARHQYPGFFIELINRINDGNLFYSFAGGLGFNFFGTLTYYLMSPLNFLVLLFTNKTLTYFFMIIIYIRVGLSGLTMAIYLNSQENSKQNWTIVFSTIFALCGFLAQYYYNFMWIDSIIMLPLIMLGIDKIFKGEKALMYIICLSLAIIFNYYMGVILCIFCVIYYLYKCSYSTIPFKKTLSTFIISSLVSGLLCCIILIPTFFVLIEGKATIYGSDWINYSGTTANLTSFFYELTPASYIINDQAYGPAQVYSTIFALAFGILFFFNSKFSSKEKFAAFAILFFYYLCFTFNFLDYAWQLFQRPIWWQSRYSYTFSFFLILLGYKCVINSNTIKITKIGKTILALIFLGLFLGYGINVISNSSYVNGVSRYFFLGFSILFFIQLLYLCKEKNINWYFYILIILELGLNTYNGFTNSHYNNTYKYITDNIAINETALNYVKEYDDSFYRMEIVLMNTNNDGMLNNYRGINFFNSTRNQATMNFLSSTLGITVDSGCGLKLNNFLPDLMSLFNVRYLIGNLDYYKMIFDDIDKSVYENTNDLSIGFMVNKNLDISFVEDKEQYNIERIYSAFTDSNVVLYNPLYLKDFDVKLDNTQKTSKYEYEVIDEENDGYVTLSYKATKDLLLIEEDNFGGISSMAIGSYAINKDTNKKEYVETTEELNNGKFIYLKKDDTLILTYKVDVLLDISTKELISFDIDEYQKAVNILEENTLKLQEETNHLIEGDVVATTEKSILFTSIPYEKGFTIKVDGKKVDITKIFDTFIGIELEPGEHHITIDYVSYGFIPGAIISGSTLLLLIAYYIIKRKKEIK